MWVISQECRSCKKCIEVCPVSAITLKENKAYIDHKKCILCACCQEICPYKAIILKKGLLLKILGA
jgi:ferredoxin